MRNLWFATAFSCMGAAFSFAAEHDHKAMGGAAKAAEDRTIAQKTCPVTGEPIKRDVFIEHDGVKVYFCCSGCIPKFKASPMKYLPAVYRQVYPQTVQVKCPVMGETVDGKTSTEYQGRRIDFCCDSCISKFKADPAKYLSKIEKLSTNQVHCPIRGKAVDPAVNVEHKGKTIYFNSEDALAKFKSGPEKYAAALRPQAGIVARGPTADDDLILTLDPTGNTSIHRRKDLKAADYEDKVFFLSGDDGVKGFKANPTKYATTLAGEMKKLGIPGVPSAGAGRSGSTHGEKKNTESASQREMKHDGQGADHANHNH